MGRSLKNCGTIHCEPTYFIQQWTSYLTGVRPMGLQTTKLTIDVKLHDQYSCGLLKTLFNGEL